MDSATALGSSLPLEFEGRQYVVQPIDEGTIGDYEAWLKGSALQDLYGVKQYMQTSEQWKEAYDEVWFLITTKQFAWGSEICLSSLKSLVGLKQLAKGIVMRTDGTNPTEEELADILVDAEDGCPSQLGTLITLRMEESLPKSRAAKKAAAAKAKKPSADPTFTASS